MVLESRELDRLVARMAPGQSAWNDAEIDVPAVARRARVEHAAETLLQLGYDRLAGELLRLERNSRADAAATSEYPPAA